MKRLLHFISWLLRKIYIHIYTTNAREYSNILLKRYLKYFEGDIINVSGWEDSDKENNYYRNYYKSCDSYTISNVDGENGMPEFKAEGIDYIYLDLNKPFNNDLKGKFDVVFSHTVIEHVFDNMNALDIISSLSRDIIITVLPFSQPVHYTKSYGDFHRFTPRFLTDYFKSKGYTTLLSDFNDQPFHHIYVINICSKNPEKYFSEFKDAPMNFDVNIYSNKLGKMK